MKTRKAFYALLVPCCVLVATTASSKEPWRDRHELRKEPQSRARPLRCNGNEPRIDEVVEAVWAHAGMEPGADKARMKRAGWSGLFPRLDGAVAKDTGGRWSSRYSPGSTQDTLQWNAGWSWQVGLTWDLSGLVWTAAEVREARENARRALERMDMATQVVRAYVERKKLLAKYLSVAKDELRWRIMELTALLDAWSGWAFRNKWCEVAR